MKMTKLMNLFDYYNKPEELELYYKPYSINIKDQIDNPYNDDFTTFHYRGGKTHREDGPAIISAAEGNAWYQNDKLHREDGPAIIRNNGDKYWYLNGEEYTEEEWKQKTGNY